MFSGILRANRTVIRQRWRGLLHALSRHTLLYLRFYQRFLRAPLLGPLVAWLSLPFNRLVAHQDRRIVVTQRPVRPLLRGDERLIPGDRPIVEYRRRRQALLDVAKANAGAAVEAAG